MKMKVMLEIKDQLKENDILLFNGNEFECVNFEVLTTRVQSEVKDLKIALSNADETIQRLAKEIRILKGEE